MSMTTYVQTTEEGVNTMIVTVDGDETRRDGHRPEHADRRATRLPDRHGEGRLRQAAAAMRVAVNVAQS